MTEQPEAGDVGGSGDESSFPQLGSDRVHLRHERNRRTAEIPARQATLNPGRDDTGAKRFREEQQIPRFGGRVRQHFSWRDNSSNRQPVDRFGIANGMTTDDGTADFARLFQSATEDLRDRFGRDQVFGHTHEIQRGKGTATHCKDVGKGIGGRDLTVGERVVHDGSKKIGGVHKGAVAIETENTGVVSGGGANENVAIRIMRKLTQNLRQGLLAQLGSSAGAG